ncbi:MAG: diguanylate cyclase [Pseudomonadota bacterium]|nr:diguanylate cyclase [Pseudomonadota bacterium]
MRNDTSHHLQRLLEIRWVNFREIGLFEKPSDAHTSHLTPVPTGPEGSSHLYRIELAAGASKRFFLRVRSDIQFYAPIFVWQPEAFQANQTLRYNWYFLAFGALAALTLYNFSLFVFTRDRTYLYYSFYAFSIIIYQLCMTGLGHHYLWSQSQWLQQNGMLLGVNLSFMSGALFFREFLNLKAYPRWMLWSCNAVIAYWFVSLVLLLLFEWAAPSGVYNALGTCVLAVGGTVILLYWGNVSARYYAMGWAALLFFTMATLMMVAGHLPYSETAEYGQMVGFVSEMLLLSVALAERINRERRQHAAEQSKNLLLQMEINRERENTIEAQQQVLRMEQEAKQELEMRVLERTETLEQVMSKLRAVNDEMARMSVTDALTQAYNRRHFDQVLQEEIARASRTRQPLGLIMLDIDHFKQFNDRYGHTLGDECLRQVSDTLTKVVTRSTDLVARYGGEEFVVLLPGADTEAAARVAEKLRQAIESLTLAHQEQSIPVTASLGIVSRIPGPDTHPDTLVNAADKALYTAKGLGRNQCVMYQPDGGSDAQTAHP